MCNAEIADWRKICLNCGYCFVGFVKPDDSLQCHDPGYVLGLSMLENGDPGAAFDEWRKCLGESDEKQASALYESVLKALGTFLVKDACEEELDYLSKLPALDSEFRHVLGDGQCLSRDLCVRLSEDLT
ncbi:MAG: hypothetical protein J5674_03115, partial [Candidatus Methanomethylophilaceae archaeon]|nr:hypothetical protein [Candidatus Methanomethylophilaceae archaeon]